MSDGRLTINHLRRRLTAERTPPPPAHTPLGQAIAQAPPPPAPARSRSRRERLKDRINRIPVLGALIRYPVKLLMIPARFYEVQRKVSALKTRTNELEQALSGLTAQQTAQQSAREREYLARLNDFEARLQQLTVAVKQQLPDAFEQHITNSQVMREYRYATEDRLLDLKTQLSNLATLTQGQLAAAQNTVAALQKDHNQLQQTVNQVAQGHSKLQSAFTQLQTDFGGFQKSTSQRLTALDPAALPPFIGPDPVAISGPSDLTEGYTDLDRLLDARESSGRDDDLLYVAFEAVLRGSEQVILERQRLYLDTFLIPGPLRQAPVVDVGCGCGEFLEVLRQRGLHPVGVDINAEFITEVQQKGFEAHESDAVEYLRQQDNASLAGITAFQVIEHVPYDTVQDLLAVSYDKLLPGGLILLETVNPYCLDTFRTFYLDPTHVKPVPKDLLAITMAFHGFTDIKTYWQNPVHTTGQVGPLARALYYQTYALIARKP